MAKVDISTDSTTYTLAEIKAFWNQYWHKTGFRYLTYGTWQYDFSGQPRGHIDATRAEITLLRNRITFPEFLEKYGKKNTSRNA